jgi:hypothetical protein
MRTFPVFLLAALLSFGVVACQQEGEEGDETAADTMAMEEEAEPVPPAEVAYQLVVTNPMPHAMNVSATLPDGSQIQLGTVPAGGESAFSVAGSAGETVTVVAVDEANTHSPTGSVMLPSGETAVSWTIQ